MMYTFDILTAFFVMATGFAASWAGLDIVRWAGGREPALDRVSGSPARIGANLALAAMIGPRLLLANGFRNWRTGSMSFPLFVLLALVSAGWSMCSGVLVLQVAFASGFFLA